MSAVGPPYRQAEWSGLAGACAAFKRYTRQQVLEADRQRLAESYHEFVRRGAYLGAYLVLSHADTELAHRRYRGHRIQIVQAPRANNHCGDDRGPVSEILVTLRALPR